MGRKGLILAIIGILLLAVGIIDLILWFVAAANDKKSFEETLTDYLSNFPVGLRNPINLTLINVVLFGLSIIFFVFAIKYTNREFYRRFLYALIVLSGLLAFWNLFSLM